MQMTLQLFAHISDVSIFLECSIQINFNTQCALLLHNFKGNHVFELEGEGERQGGGGGRERESQWQIYAEMFLSFTAFSIISSRNQLPNVNPNAVADQPYLHNCLWVKGDDGDLSGTSHTVCSIFVQPKPESHHRFCTKQFIFVQPKPKNLITVFVQTAHFCMIESSILITINKQSSFVQSEPEANNCFYTNSELFLHSQWTQPSDATTALWPAWNWTPPWLLGN